MSSSLMTSVSGLNAYNEMISVISNNIANSGTTSYKTSSVTFADLLNQSLSASATSTTGSGVTVSDIATDWTQGSVTGTTSATDLAINGNGFFVVKTDDGQTYYTRNGSFSFDSNNTLVDDNGNAVQGYSIAENGSLGALGDIVISFESSVPVTTTSMSTSLSLNSEEVSGGTFSTTTVVYDSLGNEIPITMTYTKSTTDNTWTYAASIASEYGTLTGGTGTLTFSTSGTLQTGTADPVFTLNLTNGATTGQTIIWDIYNDDGTTNGNLVQYASDSVLNDSSQNGSPSVTLQGITVDENGIVIGSYSDGSSADLYQLSLANFSNYEGLKDEGSGLYSASFSSGEAVLGTPGTGQFGTISSESLESSNVDLTSQLANLITAQRAYQACAKVFTTADEVLQTTVNMK
ncbi:MAG: flagellar hook protein FlgE [Deltaproteobacteria bacterium]|nr:flagellar hook protein FlgE [Deltaproteobacteria bacterium]